MKKYNRRQINYVGRELILSRVGPHQYTVHDFKTGKLVEVSHWPDNLGREICNRSKVLYERPWTVLRGKIVFVAET